MKKYNEKLIDMSKRMSQDTLRKSKSTVERLTNPSNKISRVGATIGGVIGVGLICAGAAGVLLGSSVWGVGSLITGATTIVSNTVHIRKHRK